jgi:protease-4
MDLEGQSVPPSAGSTSQQQPVYQQPPKKKSFWKIVWGIFTGLSVLGNFFLVILLIFVGAMFFFGSGSREFNEDVIRSGPYDSKIAVINLDGIIEGPAAQDIYTEFKRARNDDYVRGVILRVNSPGGLVSASDEIYNEIITFRKQTGKPVVAFMQGTAASGAYYSAVACDTIIAEPTVITGSIGVIMEYFVLQELLEGKLGIQPVVIKSGQRKDWPSMFSKPDDEQIKYLQDKLIAPTFERFVKIVADSRKVLTREEVNSLADGSIYGADEALKVKLIDNIGYIDDAIAETMKLAKIQRAKVVQYQRPFTLASLLGLKNDAVPKLDADLLHKLNTPRLMYLWSIN